MRVALVTTYLSTAGGGVSAVVEDLSRSLTQRGLNVRVFGLSDELWISQKLKWTGSDVYSYPAFGALGINYSREFLVGVKEFNPDIIHTHGIWGYTAACVPKYISSCPYLVSPHGMLDNWALANSKFKKIIASLLFERKNLQRASCIHALNCAEEKSILDFGISSRIVTIPNGVNFPHIDNPSIPPWHDTVDADKKVLLFLGRLHPKKNLHGLISAFINLAKNELFDSWVLVIAGWGDQQYINSLAKIVSSESMDQRILFVGPLFGDKKHLALMNATAFVLPSYSEGLPMAVLEAWSYKLPVAITKECNLDEGFSNGAAVEIKTDLSGLTMTLSNFLLTDRNLLRAMGEKGHTLLEEKFNWPVVSAQFESLYQELIENNS